MIKKVRKAVIPAAGLGTRFLPQTKAMPKEMLPLVDKPMIQYIVENLVDAGIKDIIIVTGYHKRAIEDHFDNPSAELVNILKNNGKTSQLEELLKISNLANFFYVRQKGPYGNGTPLLNVKDIIGDEPFIYTWGDDMIFSHPNEFKQLIGVYKKYGCSVLSGLRARDDNDFNKWGFVKAKKIEDYTFLINKIIEKPGKEKAPSNLGTISSFLFTPEIFNYLDIALKKLQKGQELYYNDALKLMLEDKKKILIKEITGGEYLDTGNRLEYLKSVTKLGLKNKEVSKEYLSFIKSLIRAGE